MHPKNRVFGMQSVSGARVEAEDKTRRRSRSRNMNKRLNSPSPDSRWFSRDRGKNLLLPALSLDSPISTPRFAIHNPGSAYQPQVQHVREDVAMSIAFCTFVGHKN